MIKKRIFTVPMNKVKVMLLGPAGDILTENDCSRDEHGVINVPMVYAYLIELQGKVYSCISKAIFPTLSYDDIKTPALVELHLPELSDDFEHDKKLSDWLNDYKECVGILEKIGFDITGETIGVSMRGIN